MGNFQGKKTRKLNYIIHSPNAAKEMADALFAIFVSANEGKVERVLKELAAAEGQAGEWQASGMEGRI